MPNNKTNNKAYKKDSKNHSNPTGLSYYDRYTPMPVMGGAAGQLGFTSIDFPKLKQYRKEDAAFLSSIGNVIGTFLPVIGKPIAAASSLPDILYDAEDFIKNSSWDEAGHIMLNGINRATKWTTTKMDDILSVAGMVDDYLQSQGIDIFSWLDNTFASPNTNPKTKNKSKK